jgi:hypothetical protein
VRLAYQLQYTESLLGVWAPTRGWTTDNERQAVVHAAAHQVEVGSL